jgi:hypothetical protein
MCGTPQSGTLCLCNNTSECGAGQCCISNENTNPALVPGTCTAMAQQILYTEWCRCQNTTECLRLFPLLVGQVCCVHERMVCDAPGDGETCNPP